jgi:putative Mg2+ transporter-C (MgtC) family protein
LILDWWPEEFIYPLLGSLLAGGLIGFEREYRARPAGLRTHMLVCLSSALLMLAAVHQVRWLTDTPNEVIRIDPVRMAHGVLTGIGFLCGGVIFRQGLSVHGLTTAASLWTTSALGILYGVGFYGLAVGGTAVTLVVLALLRGLDRIMPRIAMVETTVRYRRETPISEAEFRALAQGVGLSGARPRRRLLDRGETAEIAMTLRGSDEDATEALADRLSADPRVLEFEILPRNE